MILDMKKKTEIIINGNGERVFTKLAITDKDLIESIESHIEDCEKHGLNCNGLKKAKGLIEENATLGAEIIPDSMKSLRIHLFEADGGKSLGGCFIPKKYKAKLDVAY